MQYLFNAQLGNTRYRLSDGSLLCKDVPIARAGKQLYSANNFPMFEPDAEGEIVVERIADEVFSPESLASFEGMSVTLLHPEDAFGNIEFITPENWRNLAVGHVQDVHRGESDQSDLVLADLIIKDEIAIDAIESGLREVSCGYDAKYQQHAPGKAHQYHITGNHVALVPKGRAGTICSIGDSEMSNSSKSWYQRLKKAIKTGDADTTTELIQNAPRAIVDDEDEKPGVININLPPQQPLPPADKTSVTFDESEDMPSYIKVILSRLDRLEKRITDIDDANEVEDEEENETEEKVTADAAYCAELIQPGITIDRKVKPTAFKRNVLASSDQTLVRQIVGDADIKKMKRPVVDIAFNAAAELAKSRNTQTRTADSFRQTANTIADLNKKNREFWSNRKG